MHELYNNLAFDNRRGSVWAQGWDIADQPERWTPEKKLKVFLNPFSHNDPGWTRTFDEYYYGSTLFILSKIVDGMQKDPNMKFVWAEISFFAKWYNNLAQYFKNNVHRLIERKQLEFVTGGWVMADEANSHWYSLVQQLAEGQTWLKTQLNYTVKTSWSIDPFGLSPTMPYILKKSGFDNLLIQRTHYEVKRYMASEQALEFRWRQLFGE
jgi:alpha-mannosidase II